MAAERLSDQREVRLLTVAVRKAHPGFKAVQSSIARREGISKDRAGAILASSSRHASPAAKKANPKLRRVKGGSY